MALKVGELFASFNIDTSGVSGAVNSAEKQLSNIGKGLAIGGAAMTAAVTTPLVNAGKAIYQAGSGFDAQMSKVFAIVGEEATGSAENMAKLRNRALEMGSTTSFTAAEAGEAMQYMAMAGWKVDDMLDGLAPIMNLAAASGENLGTVSDIVTDALTAFGLTAADTAHFTDVLAAASSNSNTNVAIMGESFKYVAPLAGSLGYSVDDVAVALGLMANAGIKGSMAGTSLRQILSNLIPPTDAQAQAMEALGISLYDSNGYVKDFSTLMGDFRRAASESGFDMQALRRQVTELDNQLAAGTITEEEYDAQIQALTEGGGEFLRAISDLAGARGLSGLLAIMNASEEDFNNLTRAVDGSTGAAERMANVMLDNAQGDVTLFKSALEGLEITLWGLAEGGFREVVQSATQMVDAFRTTDTETQAGTLRLAALAAATGPVMAGLGGILPLLPKLAHTFAAVSGPAAMLALGLVALGAAAIDTDNTMGKTLEKALPALGKKIAAVGKSAKKDITKLNINANRFLASLRKSIEDGLPDIMDGISDLLTVGISTLGNSLPMVARVSQSLVKTLADGIKRNMPQLVPAVVGLLKNLATSLISNAPVVLEGMSTVMTSLLEELGKIDWSSVGSDLSAAIQKALDETGTWFKKLAMGDQYKEDASWAEVGTALVGSILTGIKTGFGNLRDFIGSLLLGDEYKPDEDWGTFGEKLIDKIFRGADDAVSGAQGFVSGILDGIMELFSDANINAASGTLSQLAGKLIGSIANKIPEVADQAGNILTKIGELIFGKDGQQGLAASAMEGAGTLATAILNAIVNALPRVEKAGDTIISTLADILKPDNISKFSDAAKTLASNLLTAITDAIRALGATASGILTAIGDALFAKNEDGNSIVSAGVDALTDIVQTILDTIRDDVIPGMGDTLGGIIDAVASLFTGENIDSVVESMTGLGEALITGIMGIVPQLAGTIGQLLGKIGEALFSTNAEGEKSLVASAIEGAGTLAASLIQAIVDSIPGVETAAESIITAIAGILSPANLKQLGTSMSTLAQNLLTGIADAIRTLGASAGSILTALGDALFGTNAEDDSVVSSGVEALTGIVQTIFDTVRDDVIPSMGDAIGSIITAIAGFFNEENLSKLGDSMGTLAGSIIDGIVDTLVATIDAILSIGDETDTEGMFSGIIAGISSFAEKVIEALANAIPKVIGASGKILGKLSEIFSADNIEQTAAEAESFADGLIGSISTSISAGIESADEEGLFGAFAGLLQNIVSGIIKAIPHAFTVGEKAVTAGFQIATELLHSITEGFTGGSLDVDLGGLVTAWISSLTGILGSALDFGGEAVSTGVKLAGSLLDSLASAFDTTFSTEGVSAIGEKLGDVARKIITGITTLLPKLFEVGGKAISAGVKLATELVGSLAEGFAGTDFSADFGGMVQSIVTGITDAVANLPALLGNVLSVGAQIASSIMTSITNAITATAESGAAVDLGQMGVQFIHQMLSGIANLGENADVQTFMTELGKGFNAAMGMLGDFAGQIVTYIVSGDAFVDLFNAGATIGQWILSGIKGVFEGLGNFFEHLVGEALVGFGIVDRDELEASRAAQQVIRDYQSEFRQAYLHAVETIETDEDLTNALFLALMGGKQNNFNYGTIFRGLDANKLETFLQPYESLFEGGDYSLIDQWATSFWLGFTGEKTDENIQNWIRQFMSAVGIDDLPDELLATMTEAFKLGTNGSDKTAFYEMLMGFLLGEDSNVESEVEAAIEEAASGAETVMETAADEVQDATANIIDSVEQGSNALAQNGMATAVREGAGPVEAAALEVSDAAVQTFLLKMSAENGKTLGQQFIGGIIEALGDGTLVAAIKTLGDAGYNKLKNILTALAGKGIGQNFGQGLADGITSMTVTVTTAAYNIGIAAVNALSSAIQEGSPSKLTAESGENFDRGFVNGLLAGADDASDAAAMMGRSAASSLDRTVSDMQGMAVDGMSLPVRYRRNENTNAADTQAVAAQQYADAIARSLNGAQVMMDGEPVGRLVMPTVSERIAAEATTRRWGTV